MVRSLVILALALSSSGCEHRPRAGSDAAAPLGLASSGPVAAATPPVTAGSTMSPSKLRALPFAANFGGVGPATPSPSTDAWVIVLVDVASSERLSGLEIKEIELLDQEGKVVGRAVPPWSLRRDPDAARGTRPRWDSSDAGTIPFNGEIQPSHDVRLLANAPLDARLQSLTSARPARFRARLIASGDPGVRVEGALGGGWATAGPVGAP